MGKAFAVCVALISIAGASLAAPVGRAFAADGVYWGNLLGGSSPSVGTISHANLDGSGLADLGTGAATVNGPIGVALDPSAGRVYWANADGGGISYANLDGSGGGDLNTGSATVSYPEGIAIDPAAGRIYWANLYGGSSHTGAISYANLDGSGGGDIDTTGATPLNNPTGVAIDPAAGRIWWANTGANKISYANLDGSGHGGDLNTGMATVNSPEGVAIDTAAGRVYWANNGANKISYANLDGSGHGGDIDTTGASIGLPVGVAIDPAAGRIWWASSFGGGRISYANLDGSGHGGDIDTTALTHNATGPSFPALLRVPVGNAAPQISGSGQVGQPLACSQGGWAADLLGAFLYRAPRSFAYQWQLDGADIAGATSASLTPGQPGSYACRVTASNQAGATAQTSVGMQVSVPLDTTPPDTVIDSGPTGATSDPTPTFSFHATEPGSTFACALDGGAFTPCVSPYTTARLADGAHTVQVRATDSAGNTDPTPAARAFVIDTAVTITINAKHVRLRGRRAIVKLVCPAAEASPPCAGTLILKTAKRIGRRGHKHYVTLAHSRYRIAAGKTKAVRLKLSKHAARLVRANKRARVANAIAHVHDTAGNRATRIKRIRLDLSKQRHRRPAG